MPDVDSLDQVVAHTPLTLEDQVVVQAQAVAQDQVVAVDRAAVEVQVAAVVEDVGPPRRPAKYAMTFF